MKLMTSCLELRRKVLGPFHHDTESALEILMAWLNVKSDTEYQAGNKG
jgi:hypothetical protein